MTEQNVKKIVEYWRKTAEYDYKTMVFLFKGKEYSNSLFFGHIVLEKILKALVVQRTKEQAPYIHDLVRL
ncbi:DNA-binding protein, partial [bacterium (Candidatus Gribaldobacteria) CG_4_10_14_0_8_um_filter_33_9]